MKKAHTEILNHYNNSKEESRNPLHIFAAVARDAAFHMKMSDTLSKFAVSPTRDVAFMDETLTNLRYLSDYKLPKVVPEGSRKKQQVNNLPSTWLYSQLVVDDNETARQTQIFQSSQIKKAKC